MSHAASVSPLLDRRFLVLETIGQGGMSRVYRAFDRSRERMVVLKLLRREHPRRLLADEFRSWALLRHPNILRAYEFRKCREGPFPAGDPYLVLEHFLGDPVHRAVRPGRVPVGELRWIAVRLLRSLVHVHDRGLVHRDVKPGNVLLRRGPRGRRALKITDFGLSAPVGRRGAPGCISGSLPYVAPETILGGTVDGRTDLYAAGILLFYLATGRLPFGSDRAEDALGWHLEGPPADPGVVRAGIPERLRRLCRRLTARRMEDRPDGAREALRLVEPGAPPGRGPRPGPGREEGTLRSLLDRARVAGPVLARPPQHGRASWYRRLRAASHLLDVSWHEVSGERDPVRALGQVVLDVLRSRPDPVADCLARHGLDHVPLEILGGIPVWDRVRAGTGEADPATRRATARGVAGLIAEQASGEPMVVVVRPGALRSPLVRETVQALERRLRREPGARCLLVAPAVCDRDPPPEARSLRRPLP